MRRLGCLVLAVAFGAAIPAAAQQAPSQTTPPDKIDPRPIQPQSPAPGAEAPSAKELDQAASADDPLGVPTTVFAVRVAGPWEAEGKRGFTRVVVTLDGERQRLFAQWLAEPDGAVVQTKELEDEEAKKLTFGDVRAEAENTGVTVFLDTAPDRDGLRDTWVLILGEPGEARFGPATN